MKQDLIKILACPVCSSSSLQITISEQEDEQVIDGVMRCSSCGRKYPVKEGIPRMIPEGDEIAKEGRVWQEAKKAGDGKKEAIKKHFEVRQANIAYHDIAADTYDEDVAVSVCQNKFNQERVEGIIRDLSQSNNSQWFLDIGCGTGNVLKFGKKYFQHAIGIDASVNMLKLANERGMEVIQADAFFLPFASSIFDAVSLFSVLHHIYGHSPVIKEVSRVLERNGMLYSDWDPQKTPELRDSLSLRLLALAFYVLKKLKLYKEGVSDPEILTVGHVDFRKEHPEVKELYSLAEYHEKSERRGLDPAVLKRLLSDAGFKDVSVKTHWQGKSFDELQLSFLQRLNFKLKSKLSKQPVDRFMENIMVIAQKQGR